jgi:hypothetical protein
MKGINLDVLEASAIDIDLRRYPAEQTGLLLDLAQFDSFLDYVYSVLLKRAPDREGRTHYRKLASRGMSRPAIVRRLLGSNEFRFSAIEAVGLTVDEFVTRAYQDILGRWPDQDGLDTYRQIAFKRNGRNKVVANLQLSSEAVRKGGGRLARIDALRTYAKVGWSKRVPLVGRLFAKRRQLRQRLDRIALNQRLLAQEVATLRQELKTVGFMHGPLGFVTEGSGMVDAIFESALIRARREAQDGV